MPRRPKQSKSARPRPLDLNRATGGVARRVTLPDGREYFATSSRPATKALICPGCQRVIPVGAAQVAAWEADCLFGPDAAVDLRRHWHTSCWLAFSS